MNHFKSLIFISASLLITACQAPTGENLMANVYQSNQLNQQQEARTVKILAVMPAKVEINNQSQQRTAQFLGGALGGLGGALAGYNISDKYDREGAVIGGVGGTVGGASIGNALVNSKVLVDGVTITYVENDKTLSSTQVGRACEFSLGTALIVSMSDKETRIQPNATCTVVR